MCNRKKRRKNKSGIKYFFAWRRIYLDFVMRLKMIKMENRNYDLQNVNFHSLFLEGTQYEVGQQMGRMINKLPGGKEFATSGKIDLKKLGFKSFAQLWDYSEECCPGITQEI